MQNKLFPEKKAIITQNIIDLIQSDEKTANIILDKAFSGGEFTSWDEVDIWFEKRFLPNLVFVNEEGYTKMCVDALKTAPTTAATDYGSTRQRDLGQLWADTTRGYIGEYGLKLLLDKRWGIKSELGHEQGDLKEYLPLDIHNIKMNDEESWRKPKIGIGIKTTKWNGIWLDIPGDQFNHSDVHVFVKVGTGRDHLFGFFKKISVFKDKVLKKGIDSGAISNDEALSLFDSLPDFSPPPAYICGFVQKNNMFDELPYKGKKGRKHYTITDWNGSMNPGDLEKIKESEEISGNVKFEGIGQFAHDKGYLFNTGNLLWENEDWETHIISKL